VLSSTFPNSTTGGVACRETGKPAGVREVDAVLKGPVLPGKISSPVHVVPPVAGYAFRRCGATLINSYPQQVG